VTLVSYAHIVWCRLISRKARPSTDEVRAGEIMTDSQGPSLPAFTERRVQHAGGSLYVRDFPGSGPAFVLLHGFPDNSLIYDNLIPHLAAAGRRTVALDFLGFGASDKPEGAVYTFEQQLGDLEAIANALELEKIIPVGHDAGGPAAVNFALRHPTRAAGICLMNAFYGESPGLRVPELIELFANKNLKALTRHFLASPEQFCSTSNAANGGSFPIPTRRATKRFLSRSWTRTSRNDRAPVLPSHR
jgi:pimeloyl-ACP methyl ester carboxylesterase